MTELEHGRTAVGRKLPTAIEISRHCEQQPLGDAELSAGNTATADRLPEACAFAKRVFDRGRSPHHDQRDPVRRLGDPSGVADRLCVFE